MMLSLDHVLQILQLATKEFSLPTAAAILGISLSQWIDPSSAPMFGASGFLIGTLITQTRNWLRSRELPYMAFLCVTNYKLTHAIVFASHEEHAMFRHGHYCPSCGNRLIECCPSCKRNISLRTRDEKIGGYCRSCGHLLFKDTSEDPDESHRKKGARISSKK